MKTNKSILFKELFQDLCSVGLHAAFWLQLLYFRLKLFSLFRRIHKLSVKVDDLKVKYGDSLSANDEVNHG